MEDEDFSWLEPVEAEDVANLNLNFQVAAVRKPLLSVKRIAELGNRVVFGAGAKDSYIENVESGKRLILRRKGRGSFVLKVRFVDGSEEDIVVDSGAEESVCPRERGERPYGTQQAERRIQFRHAGGGYMDHYGQRAMEVSTF